MKGAVGADAADGYITFCLQVTIMETLEITEIMETLETLDISSM